MQLGPIKHRIKKWYIGKEPHVDSVLIGVCAIIFALVVCDIAMLAIGNP